MTDDEFPSDTEDQEPSYDVGYKKPPKHSQFKKGNKHGKGRPRGSRNVATYVREALEAKVTASVGGKPRKVSKIELGLHQLANLASKGNLKAIAQVIPLYERHCSQENDGPIPEEETAHDLETLRHYFMMQGVADDE